MNSPSEIYFNYRRATEQAEKLDEIAKRLRRAADDDMERILNEVSRAWKSDSVGQYLTKGRKVGTDMQSTAKNIGQIASTIRTIARMIREAELEAWRIANERG